MPITVNGPDGKVHSFPDGTTGEQINAQMSSIYGGSGSLNPMGLPSAGDPTAASGAVMPSMGTTPAYNTPEDKMNIGLSMILPAGSVRALQNTPGHIYRVEQAKKAADNLASLEEKQRAGQQVLSGLDMIRHTVKTAPDDVLTNAIGPMVSSPWLQGARRTAAGVATATVPYWTPYDQSYNLNNLLHHDVHGLVTQFMAAGKAVNMSDARQEAFNATMADMLKATNRDDLNKIADHADFIIRSSFGLPKREQEKQDKAAMVNGGDEKGAAQSATPKVYVNPQTGEKIRWDAQSNNWVPIN